MFHTFREEWEWIEKFQTRYKRTPSRDAFRNQFPDFTVRKSNEVDHFCDEVRTSHIRHMLTEVMNKAADCISDGDIDGAVRSVTSSMVTITAQVGSVGDEDIITSFNDIYEEVKERRDRMEKEGSSGVPSSMKVLNDSLGGYNPGELTIYGARLGEGKSWIMQKEAAHAATQGYVVVFDALEQTRAQVAMRIHGLLSSSIGRKMFRTTSLMQGKDFDINDYEDFLRNLKKDVHGRLHVADSRNGRLSALSVATQIERHKPEIVFIDYITLMAMNSIDWQGVKNLTNELKQMCSSYQIPVVGAAQLNRTDGRGKEPPEAIAVAYGDSIAQDCDVLVTMKQQTRSVIKMRLAKARNGIGDRMWYMRFKPGEGLIDEISYNQAQTLMDKDEDDRERELAREEA